MAQIGCYMTDDEIKALETYAASIELTRAAVCSLVIQRELHHSRLKRATVKDRPDGRRDGSRRVTVHLRNPELKLAFSHHVRALGMGSDEAAGRLFRVELKERWLFKTFGHSGNHG